MMIYKLRPMVLSLLFYAHFPILLSNWQHSLEFLFFNGLFFSIYFIWACLPGLAYVLWFKGLALAETNQLTRLYALQPVCTILLATFFLHENLTPLFCCGALLILGAVLASSCPKVKKNPQETIQSNLS